MSEVSGVSGEDDLESAGRLLRWSAYRPGGWAYSALRVSRTLGLCPAYLQLRRVVEDHSLLDELVLASALGLTSERSEAAIASPRLNAERRRALVRVHRRIRRVIESGDNSELARRTLGRLADTAATMWLA